MRRRIAMAYCAGMIACAVSASAEPALLQPLVIVLGNSSGGTQTLANVHGYVDTVYVAASDGGATGLVSVSYAPIDGINAAVNVATSTVEGVKIWRPRVDGTDVAGAALTSDPPGRVALAGETVTFVVTGSATGKTWRANIAVDRR